jgi:hypothetical protein
MSVKVQKDGLFLLENSAIKLEKVPESALILEKGLLELWGQYLRTGGLLPPHL